MSRPEIVICTYRVRRGREAEFERLLARHWPTLRALDLVTDRPPQHFRGCEPDGAPVFVEIFGWSSAEAAGIAHEHPEVMAIWEPMDQLTETRGGRPNLEFPHYQPLSILGAA
ncbi:MAG TPA: hypothetical protein VII72_22975 [Myxococcota bacterium]|jgi:hypothetical protein